MQTFIRVLDNTMTELYIAYVKDGYVYYGHFIPGHDNKNKKPTGVMPLSYYEQLRTHKFPGDNYIIGDDLSGWDA